MPTKKQLELRPKILSKLARDLHAGSSLAGRLLWHHAGRLALNRKLAAQGYPNLVHARENQRLKRERQKTKVPAQIRPFIESTRTDL